MPPLFFPDGLRAIATDVLDCIELLCFSCIFTCVLNSTLQNLSLFNLWLVLIVLGLNVVCIPSWCG